jgi:pyruvate dehydrogenase E2 component (dihydrolipoamide acetyltransferase)
MKMVMPKMGMTMEEGTIVEWKRKNGEYVEKGEIILEIMTNKVNIDVEAPASGYLHILKNSDEIVPVGEVIALIRESLEAEEALEALEIPLPETRIPTEKEPEVESVVGYKREKIPASPRARQLAEEKGIPLEEITGTGPDGAIIEKDILEKIRGAGIPRPTPSEHGPTSTASALAERIAYEERIDLSQVKGTGIDGKITKEDVLQYMRERKAVEKPEAVVVEPEAVEVPPEPSKEPIEPIEVSEVPRAPEPVEPEVAAIEKPPSEPVEPVAPEKPAAVVASKVSEIEEKSIPLTGIRKLTAERMLKSKREAPHLTLGIEVDMTEASKLKTSLNVSYTAILIKAAALALQKHPIMNSTLRENEIIVHDTINIGIAVARGDDLVVPVIHAADTRSLKRISQIATDVIERTQEGKLTEKDVLDGTFTISNLGMYDIDFFTPIINPPEAAILGVGKIKKMPVVLEDRIQIRERITFSLSFDHRIMNGVPAALFLKEVKELLEHPYRLLVEGT